MLYRLVRPFATIALKVNFRKIYFSNAQVIPKNKPVILAVNHPTAFLEPCLLACLLPQPLHFMVRGDLFKSNLIRKIFDSLHLIPIYRIQDAGYSGLKNNYQSFEKCFDTLKQNKIILILAEGNTIQEKRLRPIQKGTARIAVGAIEKHPELDVHIVPVGVNYTYADRFRSHVMFEFGQPIAVQDFFDQDQDDSKQIINRITQSLEQALQKHVIIIENEEDEDLAEKILAINRNNFPEAARPVVSLNNHLLKSEKRLTQTLNQMADPQKKALQVSVDAYLARLKNEGLEDWAVAQANPRPGAGWITIVVGFVPFLLGYAGNFLPAYFASYIAKTKVKYLEFKASVRVAVAIGAFLLYYLTLLLLALFLKYLFLVFFVLMLPFLGYFTILYQEYLRKWQWLRAFRKVDQGTLENLREERKSIFKQFLK